MSPLPIFNRLASHRNLFASLTVAVLICQTSKTNAGEFDRLECAVKYVPADSVYFHSYLRKREQFEAFTNSKTFHRFLQLPYIQQIREMYSQAWYMPNGELSELRLKLAQPENQELLELAKDLVSQEVFLYGGSGYAEFSELLGRLYWESGAYAELGPFFLPFATGEDFLGRIPLILNDNVKRICIPEFTVGFKVTQFEAAKSQIERIEHIFQDLAKTNPVWKGRVERKKIGLFQMLILSFDAKLISKESVAGLLELTDEFSKHPKLLDRLSRLKGQIGIGICDKYLVIALGETLDHLDKFGRGPRLIDRPEMNPLCSLTDKKLVSVDFAGKELIRKPIASRAMTKDLIFTALVDRDNPESESAVNSKIRSECDRLFDEKSQQTSAAGDRVGATLWTDQGFERFEYDFGPHPGINGQKPLHILNHVGDYPIFALAGRGQFLSGFSERLNRFVQTGFRCAELVLKSRSQDPHVQSHRLLVKNLASSMNQVTKTTTALLLPALAEGELAFVLDGKLRSKQWHNRWPTSDTSIPLIEPAVVARVSDEQKLTAAANEYGRVADKVIEHLNSCFPGQLKGFTLPRPSTKNLQSGLATVFPLPASWGIDEALTPTMGLSKEFLALACSVDHADRLLKPTPLMGVSKPLADKSKRMALAVYFSPPRLIDTIYPWIEFAAHFDLIKKAFSTESAEFQESVKNISDMLLQVKATLDLIKGIELFDSCTYIENGIWVTHSEIVIKDQ